MGGSICCLTFLMTMLVSTFIIQYAEACSCAQEHIQTKFCRSDFVARVKIRIMTEYPDKRIRYRVKLAKIYKATPQVNETLQLSRELWFSPEKTQCQRLTMKIDEIWVVGGKMNGEKAYMDSCSLAMRWSEVHKTQRRGFKSLYQEGCTCEISSRTDLSIGTSDSPYYYTKCLFDDKYGPSYCQQIHGICMRDTRKGSCSWRNSNDYVKCAIDAALLKERSS